jgi:hypothetical protein
MAAWMNMPTDVLAVRYTAQGMTNMTGSRTNMTPRTEAGVKSQMQEALKHPRRGAEHRLLAALDKAAPPQFFDDDVDREERHPEPADSTAQASAPRSA